MALKWLQLMFLDLFLYLFVTLFNYWAENIINALGTKLPMSSFTTEMKDKSQAKNTFLLEYHYIQLHMLIYAA